MESSYLEMLRTGRDAALGGETCIGQEVALGDLWFSLLTYMIP